MAVTEGSGAAFVVDREVINNTGAARKVGDIVAIDIEDGGSDVDGHNAVLPLYSAKPEGSMVWHGAIQHMDTTRTFKNGDSMNVRFVGPGKVRVKADSQAVAAGDLLIRQNGDDRLITAAAQPDLTTALADPTATTAGANKTAIEAVIDYIDGLQVRMRAVAVARGAVTTSASGASDSLIDAYIHGTAVQV